MVGLSGRFSNFSEFGSTLGFLLGGSLDLNADRTFRKPRFEEFRQAGLVASSFWIGSPIQIGCVPACSAIRSGGRSVFWWVFAAAKEATQRRMKAFRMGYAALDPLICSDARRLAVPVAGAVGVWCADGWTESDVAGRAWHEGHCAVLCGIGLSDLESELS